MQEMPDSIIPANLPDGYGQYLVYVDGTWPTEAAVRARYPGARLLTMTVLGGHADGCDCENGDLTPAQAAAWARDRLAAGARRPVIYASAGTMVDVLAELAKLGVARDRVRLHSAHYGQDQHLCGPGTCKAMTCDADATQWTETFPGTGGTQVDMSAISDDYFGTVSSLDAIPLDILGPYTNGHGDLFVIGLDADGVLHESKRTAPGKWTAPYQIGGKAGA